MANITIAEVRAKYPQYKDMSDGDLADALHSKFYPQLDKADFYGRIGYSSTEAGSFAGRPALDALAQGINPQGQAVASLGQHEPKVALPGVDSPISRAAPGLGAPMGTGTPPVLPNQAPMKPDPPRSPSGLSEALMAAEPAGPVQSTTGIRDQEGREIVSVDPHTGEITYANPAETPAPEADPFVGEGLGPLARRRGQQFAQGATEGVASLPEALAISAYGGQLSRRDRAGHVAERQMQMVAEMDQALADPSLAPDARAFILQRRNEIAQGIARMNEMAQAEVVPAEETDLFKAGDKVRDKSAEAFGTPDPRDTGFWSQVAHGGGNMAAMVAAGVPTMGVGGAAMGASMNAQQLYKEAKEAGADDDVALQAARWGGIIGSAEIVPITRALKLLPSGLRKKATNTVYKRAAHIAGSAGEEAAQEYLAQVANNMVASGLYDPERGWTEGALESAAVGAVLGGGLGAAGSLRGNGETQPAPEAETTPAAPPESQPTPDAPVQPDAAPETPAAEPDQGQGEILDVQNVKTGEMMQVQRMPDGTIKAVDEATPPKAEPAPEIDPEAAEAEAVERLKAIGIEKPKKAPQKKPFTDRMKKIGIDPSGQIAAELKARGITSKTAPGLFRKGGAKDLDNLPHEEWVGDYPHAEADDTGNYVNRQWFIDRLSDEAAGFPVNNTQQQQLQDRADVYNEAYEQALAGPEEALRGETGPDDGMYQSPVFIIPDRNEDISTDAERRKTIEDAVHDRLVGTNMGGKIRTRTVSEVISNLQDNGGDVDEALFDAFGVIEDIQASGPSDFIPFLDEDIAAYEESTNDKSPEAAASAQDLDEGAERAGRPQGNTGAEGESTGSSGGNGRNAGKPITEQTEAGQQQLIPGVAPVTDKDRAQAQQDKPMRGGDNAMQDDGLFGDPTNRGDLFDAPPSKDNTEAERQKRADDAVADKARRDHASENATLDERLPGRQKEGMPAGELSVGPNPDGGFMVRSGVHFGSSGHVDPFRGGYETEREAFDAGASSIRDAAEKVSQNKGGHHSKMDVRQANKILDWLDGITPPSDQDGIKKEAKKQVSGINEEKSENTSESQKSGNKNQEPVKSDYGAGNTLVSQDRADELRKRLKDKLKNQINSGFDPEMLSIGVELAAFHIEAGTRRFVDLVKAIASDIDAEPEALKKYARAWYNGARDMIEDAGLDVSDMDDPSAVRAIMKDFDNEFRNGGSVERGGPAGAGNSVGQGDLPAGRDGAGREGGSTDGSAGAERGGADSGPRVSNNGAPSARADRNSEGGQRGDDTGGGVSRNPDADGSGEAGRGGISFGPRPDEGVADAAEQASPRKPDLSPSQKQKAANEAKLTPKWGDADSIDAMLPALFPSQRKEVLQAEKRYFNPDEGKPQGEGYLTTSGTGTGKSFILGGVVKRFHAAGKGRILILTKTNPIKTVSEALDVLDVPHSVLKDGKDAGDGVVITTINGQLGLNKELGKVEWDLIVGDEINHVMESMDGKPSTRTHDFRGIALHPRHLNRRADMELHEQIKKATELKKQIAKANAADDYAAAERLEKESDLLNDRIRKQREALLARYTKMERPKVFMASATPFATVKTVDFAEGFLFDYPTIEDSSGYNAPDGRDAFMIQHFGYRMRYNKLTAPEADVDQNLMARTFHEWLRDQGSVDGNVLDVDHDYERMFIAVDGGIGNKIDEGFQLMWDNKDYRPLNDAFKKVFTYHKQVQLLEAIKAPQAIEKAKKDIALGRKVIFFHDRQVGGGLNPFDINEAIQQWDGDPDALRSLWGDFLTEHPWVGQLDFSGLRPAREQIFEAFPKAMPIGSGINRQGKTVSKKASLEAHNLFQMDNSGVDVVVTQAESGKDGWSGHDTTGVHQRAIHNLGLPVRPTQAVQQEGRAFRVGQASDAIFRYYNTQTLFEERMFAQRMAERADIAEALAMGNKARGLRESIIDSFVSTSARDPRQGEGKGGKQKDRAAELTPWDRATSFYFSNQKESGKRDQRAGKDYFATPEPLGLKMVEWADIKGAERVLEPSAGHGAIARWMPENTDRTIIEPSQSLMTKAMMYTPGARHREHTFEDLHIGVKYDAIVMNPPFGSGGKLAYEHVEKALGHLRNGGRVVALVPAGPAADKRMAAMIDSDQFKNIGVIASLDLPAITFKRAGTSVKTRILVLEKQTDADNIAAMSSMSKPAHRFKEVKDIKDFFDEIKHHKIPSRLIPKEPEPDNDVTPAAAAEVKKSKVELEEVGSQTAVKLTTYTPRPIWKAMNDHAKDLGGKYSKASRGWLFDDKDAASQMKDVITEKFRRSGDVRADFRYDVPILHGAARQRLDDLGLKDVKLDWLEGVDRDDLGRFQSFGDTRRILLNAAYGGMDTLNHEAIHALRNLGLFTDAEWKALEKVAPKWRDRYSIDERYPDLSEDARNEEAIAEAFAEWAAAKRRHPNEGVFKKIYKFFHGIAHALLDSNMSRAESVFDGVDSGHIGQRQRSDYQVAVDKARRTTGAYGGYDHAIAGALNRFYRGAMDTGMRHGWVFNLRRFFQDAFLRWKDIGEGVGDNRVYQNMGLFDSKAGAAMEDIEVRFKEPIAALIGKNKLSQRAVGAFLMRRHADERDREIKKRFGHENGSGLSAEMIAEIDAEMQQNTPDQMKALQEIGQLVDEMHKEMRDLRVASGLISKEHAASWSAYKHYVPLKGFDEMAGGHDLEEMGGGNSTGKGFNVRGPEALKARGRKNLADMDTILANVMTQVDEAIIRAHKNEVGQVMLDVVENNPSDHWALVKKKPQLAFNPDTGTVDWISTYSQSDRNNPSNVFIKVGGKEVLIKMKDPALARAYGKLDFARLTLLARIFRPITSAMSGVLTRWNPIFVFGKNLPRDIATALIMSRQYASMPGHKGLTMKVAKNALPAARAMFKTYQKPIYRKDANGNKVLDANSEWARWAQEFRAVGGPTAFAQFNDLTRTGKQIEKMARRHASDHVVMNRGRDFFMFMPEMMEHFGGAIENATRLALYRGLREITDDKGRPTYSKEAAANEAKNLTVNFNRRGEMTSELSSYFMFVNAAIQGAHAILTLPKRLGTKRTAGYLMALVATGMLSDLMGAGLQDDEEYDSLPEYEKQRNLILPSFTGEGFNKVSLPYGFSTFINFGRVMSAGLIRGKMSGADMFGSMVSEMGSSWSPMGNMLHWSAAVPDAADPVAQAYFNQNAFFGGKIHFGDEDRGPMSHQSQPSQSWVAGPIAQKANLVTGGSDIEKGKLDMHPKQVDHVLRGYLGGYYTLLEKSGVVASRLYGGQSIKTSDIPILDAYTADRKVSAITGAAYDTIDEVEGVMDFYYRSLAKHAEKSGQGYKVGTDPKALAKAILKKGIPPDLQTYLRENRDLAYLGGAIDERGQLNRKLIKSALLSGAKQAVVPGEKSVKFNIFTAKLDSPVRQFISANTKLNRRVQQERKKFLDQYNGLIEDPSAFAAYWQEHDAIQAERMTTAEQFLETAEKAKAAKERSLKRKP
ncbi:LPD38 domain-containing protein [Thalassobius sp. Cn5-15]|uniref:LPD38 domain-containing protein n=1 Tax=Thalassobius sp. Cn5-15 TaxID=2917763 RepID=UPI001EF217EF|nr:LPD38 domain-containing protein [Thalassobius sp. Cn5-15]MCG7492462.1 hypothetical protein [Thalassobius sp. Cn5-15]